MDAAAEVEGDCAVIPEYGPEHELREYAAYVLIGAAKNGSGKEDIPVTLVFVFVEQGGKKGAAKTPDNAERAVDHAAAAHEHPCGGITEYGFRHVPEQGAQEEKAGQLIKAAALGKYLFAGAFFAHSGQNRNLGRQIGIGAEPPLLDPAADSPGRGQRGISKTPPKLPDRGQGA